MDFENKILNGVLDVAEKLFNSYGYCSVGVDTISTEANVSKTTMYKYFCSKEILIEQMLIRRDRRFREELTHSADSSDTPVGKIKSILKWHLDWFNSQEFAGCMFISANHEFHRTNQKIVCVIQEHKIWLESLIRDCLGEPSVLRDEYARIITIMIEGMISYAGASSVHENFQFEFDTILSWVELMRVPYEHKEIQ